MELPRPLGHLTTIREPLLVSVLQLRNQAQLFHVFFRNQGLQVSKTAPGTFIFKNEKINISNMIWMTELELFLLKYHAHEKRLTLLQKIFIT